MKGGFTLLLALCLLASANAGGQSGEWPPVSHEAKPWTRWWWLGSAVDRANLTRELEALHAAGIGGVEITPIYGVRGAESRYVPFLSAEWVGLLEHTLSEARRIGLGVDMATGTGWPFGGPWVGDAESSRGLAHKTWTVDGGSRLQEPIELAQTPLDRRVREAREQIRDARRLPLVALMAYGTNGEILDLTARVGPDGALDWTAPAGRWTLYGLFLGWHGKFVERAAPGGEGAVIDHFSQTAIRHYLGPFDRAFSGRNLTSLRAFFNDSYEVDDASGQADGTPSLLEEFQRRRGYDLRRHLPELLAAAPTAGPASASDPTAVPPTAGPPPARSERQRVEGSDARPRVLADYRETISDLLLDTFTTEWATWARRRGAIVRNQAHGSPANLLDLYAASDIPETEGTEIPRATWASSAGHVAGRRLISAEAATWLGEHFRSTLADVRADLDRFFISGVNHIVYHGTAYSPEGDAWPGWLFYAAVEFNSRNPWWRDFPTLNQYVARVQSFLQAGRPDHDVLLYYPFYDSLAIRGSGLLAHFGGANQPAEGTAFEAAAAAMQQRGFTYDYVSDRQALAVTATNGRLITGGGGSYQTLVVPASRFIQLETMRQVLQLARAGATIIFYKGLPTGVTGLADLDRRRTELRQLTSALTFGPPNASGVSESRAGSGVVLRGDDLAALLARARVVRERMTDQGLAFARRTSEQGRLYFISNSSAQDVDGWVPLAARGSTWTVFDPMRGRRGHARTRTGPDGEIELRLQIPAGESLVVAATARAATEPYPLHAADGASITVNGPWTVRFVAGGPTLPAERTLPRLVSWTTFGGDDVTQFSGTATYTARFARPSGRADAWQLDLGRVHESASVRLNGRDLGSLIGPRFRITIDRGALASTNVLEVTVTNLMANRIAAMERAGVVWKKFYNVNFPSRLPENRGANGLFTAAKWSPLDSGLLGPVTLTPLRAAE